jgi:hypothetical protein
MFVVRGSSFVVLHSWFAVRRSDPSFWILGRPDVERTSKDERRTMNDERRTTNENDERRTTNVERL